MSNSKWATAVKLCIIAAILLSATCTASYGLSQGNGVGLVNQLDKKVKAIFNERSALVNYRSDDRDGARIYYLEYESGFRVTLSLTEKSITVVEYQQGQATKKAADSKWEQACNEQSHKQRSSAEVDAFLRNAGEVQFTFVLASFKVLKDGYLIEYKRGDLRITFELDWDLKIRKRQSNASSIKVSETQVDTNTRQMILDFLYQSTGMRIYKNVQIERAQRIGAKTYRLILLITIKARTFRYEVIVVEGQKAFQMQQGQFNIDFTPVYKEDASFDKEFVQGVDALVRENVRDRKFDGYSLFKVQNDEPFYRFYYRKGQALIIVEFVFDPVIRRVKVIKSEAQTPQPVEIVDTTTQITDEKKRQIFTFVSQAFGSSLQREFQLQSLTRVSQRKYMIILRVTIRLRQLRYQLSLTQNSAGKFEIDDAQIITNFNPSYDDSTDFQGAKDIDGLVRQALPERIPSGYTLTKILKDEPYYRFFYTMGDNKYQVDFTFDPFVNKVVLSGTKFEKSPLPVVTKEPIKPTPVPIKPTPVPVVPKDEFNDNKKNEIFAFVSQSFGTFPRGAQLDSINRIGQRRYVIIFRIVSGQRQLRYQVTVSQDPTDKYVVEDGQFQLDFTPVLQDFTDLASLSDIDSLVRQSLPEKMPAGFVLSRVQRDDPFFRFFYTMGASKYQIDFSFDPFIRKAFVVNVRAQMAPEPVVVKEPIVVIKEPVNQPTITIQEPKIVVEDPVMIKKDPVAIKQPITTTTTTITDKPVIVIRQPTITVNDPVTVQLPPKPAQPIADPESVTKQQISKYLFQSLNKIFPADTSIDSITKTDLLPQAYRVIIATKVNTRTVRYSIIVNKRSDGLYEIFSSEMLVDFMPVYQESTDLNAVRDIDPMVRQSLPEKLPAGFTLTRVQRDDPFFRFFYTQGANSYQIDFTFDPYAKKITVSNMRAQMAPEPAVTVKQPTIVIDDTVQKSIQTSIEQPSQKIVVDIRDVVDSKMTGQKQTTITDVSSSSTSSTATSTTSIIPNPVQDIRILPQIDNQIPIQSTSTVTTTTTQTAQQPSVLTNQDYSRIPAQNFLAMTAEVNPVIIEMANYALGNLLPEIEKIDSNFKVSNVYYYIRTPQSIVFKFEFVTSYGGLTYYFEVVQQVAPVQTEVIVHEAPTQQVITTTVVDQPARPVQEVLIAPLTNTNELTDSKKNEIFAFVSQSFGTFPRGTQLESINRVGQRRYVILIRIGLGQRQLKYQITVSQDSADRYVIEDGQFLLDFTPTYQEFTNLDTLKDLDILVRSTVPEKIPSGFTLTRVQRDEPFYRFFYTQGGNGYQVDFTFDPFARKVLLTNVKAQLVDTIVIKEPTIVVRDPVTIQQPVTITKPIVQEPAKPIPVPVKPVVIQEPVKPTPIPIEVTVKPTVPENTIQFTQLPVDVPAKPVTVPVVPIDVPKIDEFNDNKKNEIFAFVSQAFGTFPRGAQLDSINRIGQRRYVLIFRISSGQRQLKYQVTVSQDPADKYIVEDGQFQLDFTPVLQDFTDLSSLSDIDSLVRQSLPEKMPAGFVLSRVQRDDPFFRFFYTMGASKYQIDFSFDPFTRKVFLVNIRAEKAPEPVIVKEPIVVVQEPAKQPTIVIQEPKIVVEDPVMIPKQPSKPSTTTTTTTTTTVIPAPSTLTEQDFMTYNLLKYSESELSTIYDTIQREFKDFNFKGSRVSRVQKIAYGFRIIVMIGEDLYEAVLKYNSSNGQYKLLRWRKISQKDSESTDSFYDYITISLDKELELILLKTFPREKLGHIKRIIEAKSKIASDGLYYEISLETDSDNQYLVSIYYKPEDNFTEILSYEQTNSKYYLTRQELNSLSEQVKTVQLTNTDLGRVFEFIDSKFSTFSSAAILYMYKINVARLGVVIYNIGLRTGSGFYYEVSIAVSATEASLIKYAKIFDGYSTASVDGSDTRTVLDFYRKETQKLSMAGSDVSGILVKDLPSIGRFYRLVFTKPYRYSIIIFVSIQGIARINGVEPIPSYYDFLMNGNFKSYGELRSLLLRYRNSKTETVVIQKPVVTVITTDYDARQDMNCLRYNDYECIRCSYRFYLNKGRCLAVPDECKEYNRETGECLTCYTGYAMSNGVCGTMNQLCQAADSNGRCIQCYKGYNLIQGLCYRIQTQSSPNLKRQSMDQLCEQERNGVCVRCTAGTYMSQKQRRCAIRDPNAEEFDEVNEVVIKCARGCALSPMGNCVRVK